MLGYIYFSIILTLSIFLTSIPNWIKVDYNPYEKIVSWNYNVIDTTDSSSKCLTWKIIDIWIKNQDDKKQYIFFPTKGGDINTYKDWIDNINKKDCEDELKDNYSWDFDSYIIDDKGIRMTDWTHKIFIWKYIFK